MVHENVDKFKSQQLQLHLPVNYMNNSELFKFRYFSFQYLHYLS